MGWNFIGNKGLGITNLWQSTATDSVPIKRTKKTRHCWDGEFSFVLMPFACPRGGRRSRRRIAGLLIVLIGLRLLDGSDNNVIFKRG